MSSLLRGTPRAPRANGRNPKRGGRGIGAGAEESSPASTDFDTSQPTEDPFKEERLKNAAKRENLRGTVNGEAKKKFANKQVRFASPPSQDRGSTGTSRGSSIENQAPDRPPSAIPANSIFSQANGNSGTSMAAPKTTSPFGAASQFGGPSTYVFGAASTFDGPSYGASTSPAASNPFAKHTSAKPTMNGFSGFGSSSNPPTKGSGFGSNAFAPSPSPKKASTPKFGAPLAAPNFSGGFGTQTKSAPSQHTFGANPFGTQTARTSPFGPAATKAGSTPFKPNGVKSSTNQSKPSSTAIDSFGGQAQTSIPNGITKVSGSKWAQDIEKLLQKNGIAPPAWPMKTPGDPARKVAVEGHWRNFREYRAKARACLIKNNCIDDPDKPKKLSEAIDFKGTCEDMCPEFEKITRIMENDVKNPEKEVLPGQTAPWPAPYKMIKQLARSAAGQDAPLPEDVRSPAALRRTLDYLMDVILTEETLPEVHGFLWDRTRAIRRDFTFQAQSMNTPEELLDQVYCLEQITRFHVIALHQMSPRRLGEKIAEDFSEQQEVEQLGKALLSLTHAYEDCQGHNVKCENEAEFRSYYVVFNAHYSGILENVQDWGWEFWGKSDQIRTAVAIVEALQNTWDSLGPLKPESQAVIAQNAYSKFFSIIQDPSISYTMACFAEIHFNQARKSALKTILSSYRKQRDQTKAWTLRALNEILLFDEEEEVERFCEAYQLSIQVSEDDEPYLSLEEGSAMEDPFPTLSQLHSSIVEQKRGDRTLQEAIHQSIFEPVEDDDSMFIPDNKSRRGPESAQKSPAVEQKAFNWSAPVPGQENLPKPASTWNAFSSIFDTPTTTVIPSVFPSASQTSGGSSPSNFSGFVPKATEPTNVLTPNINDSKPLEAKAPAFDFFSKPAVSTTPGAFVPPIMKQPEASVQENGNQHQLAAIQAPTPSSSSPFTFPSAAASTPLKLPDFSSLSSAVPTTNLFPPPAPLSTPSFGIQSTAPAVPLSSNLPREQESTLMNVALVRPPVPAPQAVPPPLESYLPAFAEWFANCRDGIVSQFVEYEAEQLVLKAVAQYQDEEEASRAKEEEDAANAEADRFRRRVLATRYLRLWREQAHVSWRRRQAREYHAMRPQRMRELRAAREAAKAVDIVAEFTASTKRKKVADIESGSSKRRSSEDMLRATGTLDCVHDPNKEIRNVVRSDSAPRREERSESPLVIPPAPSQDRHKALQKSDHRRSKMKDSILSDASYLHGGSRSFLLPSNSRSLHESTSRSNVKTDYFRLKARGITTLPNGTPIANSAAWQLFKHRRSSDSMNKHSTPKRPMKRPEVRSVPVKFNNHVRDDGDDELAQLKLRAKNWMNGDGQTSHLPTNKRALDDDDEELFARSKRLKERMGEDIAWFREGIARASMSKSQS